MGYVQALSPFGVKPAGAVALTSCSRRQSVFWSGAANAHRS
jgi:hypothetical protein